MAREKKSAGGFNWRLWLTISGITLAVGGAAVACYQVQEYLESDPHFMLSRDVRDAVRFEGIHYASAAKAARVFAADYGHSVLSIPLEERRRRLLGIDWVEDAAISRVWPNRLVVRIQERHPVAYAAFRYGALLVDAQGALMEAPMGSAFNFPVLRGLPEEETERQRRDRVGVFLRFSRDLGGHAQAVSEVDLADPEGLRVVAKVEDQALELWMGDGDYGRRFENFVKNYPEIRKKAPGAKSFDLRLDDRITARGL